MRRERVALGERGVVQFPACGVACELRALRAPRCLRLSPPPNKRMHPTADTTDVIYLCRAARRVMRSVRLLGFFKSLPETCGWQQRAALSPSSAPLSERGRASDYLSRGVAGGTWLRVSSVAAGAYRLHRAPEQAHAPDRRHGGR
jgi:hypothetical protein